MDTTQIKSFQKATWINSKLRGVFDLRETWVQELRDKGQVETVTIPREENKSDILTHCLSSGNFNKEVGRIQNITNWDWIIVDFDFQKPKNLVNWGVLSRPPLN